MSLQVIKANLRWLRKDVRDGGASLKGFGAGRGTLEKEKLPIFGMIQRGGEVVIKMLANVQQKTIKPIIQSAVSAGSTIYTDEYDGWSIEPFAWLSP